MKSPENKFGGEIRKKICFDPPKIEKNGLKK